MLPQDGDQFGRLGRDLVDHAFELHPPCDDLVKPHLPRRGRARINEGQRGALEQLRGARLPHG